MLITRYRLLSDLAFDVMFAVFPHLTAIYPVIIILLAALERTQSEIITIQATSTYRDSAGVDVRFRVGPQQSGTTPGTETISLNDVEGSSTLIGMGHDKHIKGHV